MLQLLNLLLEILDLLLPVDRAAVKLSLQFRNSCTQHRVRGLFTGGGGSKGGGGQSVCHRRWGGGSHGTGGLITPEGVLVEGLHCNRGVHHKKVGRGGMNMHGRSECIGLHEDL